MKKSIPKEETDYILKMLLDKYQMDRDGFRAYLPEVARQLESHMTSEVQIGHRSAVVQSERENLCNSLSKLLSSKMISKDEAIEALEYCATLIQDGSLPHEIDRRTLLRLIEKAVGTPVSKLTRTTRIQFGDGEARKEVAILRDVHFDLTWNDRLVRISVFPDKAKGRSKAMKLIGIF